MTTLLLWSPAYWVQKQNCCFLVTRAVCRPSWGLCRGLGYLLEKELESSSTKHQILHLLAVWNSGSGNWWRIETWDLLNWDRTLKSALHSSQRALLRRLLLLTLQKICCFLPYHICAVMDHTRSLEGIPESWLSSPRPRGDEAGALLFSDLEISIHILPFRGWSVPLSPPQQFLQLLAVPPWGPGTRTKANAPNPNLQAQ